MNAQCKKVLQDGENSKKRKRKGPGVSRVGPSGTRKAQQQQSRFKSLREDELRGPPTRTRASLKRRQYEPSSSSKVEKKLKQEDQSIKGETDAIMEEPLGASSITQPLPDKQTLELVIDTLQRKDIYEIFAEPVDPEEVEDYYEIIEEPMDFGTMRAKLHEGLYASLEQFEHDVFLISGNAMHFNSSGTIFFRQAHGIHKLAKRVFHVLRTNPENFESEFSGSRRKSGRKSQDETNEFDHKLLPKTSEKTTTATTMDAYLKNTNSLIHRSFLDYPRIARTGGDARRCESIEVDRRSTYKPDLKLNNETRSKSLIQFHQQELTYSQSLTQFVKGLGPTAQMVANRKLENLRTQPQIPTGQMWFNSSRSGRPVKELNEHEWEHGSTTYDYTSMGSTNEPGGFWGVLARKAKSILDDDNAPRSVQTPSNVKTETVSTSNQVEHHYESFENSRKIDNPKLRKGLDRLTSSLNQIGGTIGNALEEGRTIVDKKTQDIIQETRKLQNRRKVTSEEPNQLQEPKIQSTQQQTNPENQLKASRDVAIATAAKAKLLLRELKTLKADLAFAKERSSQLEEENKMLREALEKGDHPTDDDMIRLQLESLLAEKSRLANENSVYARENRFLREIVEYHQLTMQDVVYLDEGIEEVTEVNPVASRTLSTSTSPHEPLKQPTADTPLPSSPREPLKRTTSCQL